MAAIEAPVTPLEQLFIASLYDGSNAPAAFEELRAAGLGDRVDSWLSTGENLPITADEIGKSLAEQIGRVATVTGLSADAIAQRIAEMLPAVVDSASPNGELAV
ncbi:YidB family protein [Streptomyces sp. G45]|uniref:YidB family protein n=1 Tax=Streptomyces sp. G45 TaxID=3406627 RepID=UPI003C1C3EC6